MRSNLFFTSVIFLCLSLMVFFYPGQADQIDETLEDFFQNLKKSQYQNSYSLTNPSFQEATSLKQFEEYIKDFPFLSNYRSIEIQNKKIDQTNASAEVILDKEFNPKKIEFKLQSERGIWKINDFDLRNSSEKAPMIDARELFNIVHSQIQLTKEGKIEEAYQLFSDHYKQSQSIQEFQLFFKKFPIYQSYINFEIQNPLLKNNEGSFLLILKNKNEFFIFEYVLIPAHHVWQIDSLKFIQQGPLNASHPLEQANQFSKKEEELTSTGFDVKPLKETISNFLNSIKEKQSERAYKNFTTGSFQKKISLEAFQAFINKHSILNVFQDYEWIDLNINNNTAQFTLNLVDHEKKSYPLRLDLTKDQGQWKIHDIDVETTELKKPIESGEKVLDQDAKGMQFSKVRLGYEVDKTGIVKDSKSVLEAHNPHPIYVNLYVVNGTKGNVVRLLFKNLDTDSFIPPISTTLNSDGDSIITFVFSAPAEGWPKGTYELKVSAGTLSRIFNFNME